MRAAAQPFTRIETDRIGRTTSPKGVDFPKETSPSRPRRIALIQVLDPTWDWVLWSCVMAAVVTLFACLAFPSITELAVFTWLMFLTSSPTSTFLPSASEPVLMAFGKLYSPVLLATLGVAGIALVEWLNYRVFAAVMNSDPLDRVRSSRLTRTLATWFDHQPFGTTVLAALTPIPFWVVRICGVLTNYSMPRFIFATAIGRFPRLWLFAFLGTALPFRSSVILLTGAILVLMCAGVAAARRGGRVSTEARDSLSGAPTLHVQPLK